MRRLLLTLYAIVGAGMLLAGCGIEQGKAVVTPQYVFTPQPKSGAPVLEGVKVVGAETRDSSIEIRGQKGWKLLISGKDDDADMAVVHVATIGGKYWPSPDYRVEIPIPPDKARSFENMEIQVKVPGRYAFSTGTMAVYIIDRTGKESNKVTWRVDW